MLYLGRFTRSFSMNSGSNSFSRNSASSAPTRHGRKLKPRDDHRAQKPRIVLADLALREVHDEDLPLVHDLPHVNGRTRLAEDVPYQGIRDELPDFVLDRGHRLGLQTLGIAGE